MNRARASGFTLVELVMVIAIIGVIAALGGRILAQPVRVYLDTARRGDLVEAAQLTLTRVARETRLALPNSLRVSASGRAVEFLRVVEGGRYRAEPPGAVLDFAASAGTFDVIGELTNPAGIDAGAGAGVADCVSGAVDCLVVYNTGQPGADAYAQDNLAAIRAISTTSLEFFRPAPFPIESPSQRFYLVDSPVSFVCDPTTGELRRYEGYPITTAHANVDTHGELVALGASHAIAADRVTGCEFSFQPGIASRSGLLTARLTISEGGESIELVHQAHVRNLP